MLTCGDQQAGPWRRPSARRLCELVLISPGRRVSRDIVSEALFPQLGASAAANAVRRALSLARDALAPLGQPGSGLLEADRMRIWVNPDVILAVDLDSHDQKLRAGLAMAPGLERDECLVLALGQSGTFLEDEPYAEWALQPRENLEALRQEARLALAGDRSAGWGRTGAADITTAWEACATADPACEEAATALVRSLTAQGRHKLAAAAYERCRDALAQLGLRATPALEEVAGPAAPEPPPPRRPPQHRGDERRLVTVACAEVVGPSGTLPRLGSEEMVEILGGVLAEVVALVEEYGGTVTSVSGNGVVALFGAPESHEDDPERALRAMFRAITSADRARALRGSLTVRAGIETGPAVVSHIGAGAGAHYGAFGDVVLVAAALQAAARPGCALVGPLTRSATETAFQWGGTQELDLSAGGQRVLGTFLERPQARPRGDVGRRGLAHSAPLVGRGPESAAFREALRDVTAGQGRVTLVVGEPGLGKTRMVQECRKLFMAWAGARRGRLPLWLEGRAASYASARPYGLYQQLLTAWVGVAPEESDEVARNGLDRATRAIFNGDADEEDVELLAQIIGLKPGRAWKELSRLGPEPLQRATFAAVRRLISRLVRHGPTVLVLEDLHWSDPTSLRLTEELVALTTEGPLLVVLTRRPEPDPGTSALETALIAKPGLGLCKLDLCPLPEAQERELARALLGPDTPDEILKAVSDGTDGNPLFLEERLSSLIETNALRRAETGAWRLDLGAPGQVPEALERLVRSRVDRLARGPRDALVAASVLGPEFTLSALAQVADVEGGLAPALDELCSAGLVVQLRKLPQMTYRFRHSLIQEATYKGLVREQRRHLHARAAWGLEESSRARLHEVAALLGHHYAMAGDSERGAHFLELAGDHAATAFANDEALSCYRRALELLRTDPSELASPVVELTLKLGVLFWRLGRYDESRNALQEAAALVPAGAPLLAARSHRWLGQLEIEDCRDDAARAALDAAECALRECPGQDADQWGDIWVDVQLSRSNFHYWRSESDLQLAVLDALRPVVEERAKPWQKADFAVHVAGQRWRAARFVVDGAIVSEVRAARALVAESGLDQDNFHWQTLGFLLLLKGDLAEASAELEGALAAARRAGDKSLELFCLVFLAWARLRQHDVAGVRDLALQSQEVVSTHAFPAAGMAIAMLSWVAWKEGRFDEAERLGAEAIDRWRPTMVRYPFAWICLWPLVAVRLEAGRHEDAFAAARGLVSPPQMRLPVYLEVLVQDAIAAWDAGQRSSAPQQLVRALDAARELHFA